MRSRDDAPDAGAPAAGPAAARTARRADTCRLRDREIADAVRSLAERRFVALVGPVGVGTSTVLREVTSTVARASSVPARVTVVPCGGLGGVDDGLLRIADALGIGVSPATSAVRLRSLLGAHFDTGSHLLALDDAPPALRDLGAVVADWLAVAPDLRVIVAGSAPLDGAAVVPIAPFDAEQAAEFLSGELRQAARSPTLTADDVARALQQAGGLPIALRVVAARIATFGRLPDAGAGWPELRATLERALSALPDHARRCAASIATFRGSFTAHAARAVAGGDDADAALDALRRASLLELVDDAGGPRLRLLGPLRDALPRVPDAVERHARYFATATATTPQDRDDLVDAFDWLARHAPDDAVTVALSLDAVLVRTGPAALHVDVLRRAAALPAPAARRARVLRVLGRLLAMHGRGEEAVDANEEAVRSCDADGDAGATGWALMYLCFSARVAGRLQRARTAGVRAMEIGEALRDDGLLSMALQVTGLVDQDEDDHAAALALFVRAEAFARRVGDPRMIGICAANHAMSHIALGDGGAAQPSVARAQAAFASAGDDFHAWRIAWMEAAVHRLLGDLGAASVRIGEALAWFVARGDDAGELEAAMEALQIARLEGDRAKVEALTADIHLLSARVDEACLRARAARLLGAPAPVAARPPHSLRLVRSAGKLTRVWIDGVELELGRRGPLRAILLALGEHPGRTFQVAELLSIGWPGERMTHDSGTARVYMTMRRLRAFGLRDLLVTDDAGYRLHASVGVVVDDVKLGTVRFADRRRGASVRHAPTHLPHLPVGSVRPVVRGARRRARCVQRWRHEHRDDVADRQRVDVVASPHHKHVDADADADRTPGRVDAVPAAFGRRRSDGRVRDAVVAAVTH